MGRWPRHRPFPATVGCDVRSMDAWKAVRTLFPGKSIGCKMIVKRKRGKLPYRSRGCGRNAPPPEREEKPWGTFPRTEGKGRGALHRPFVCLLRLPARHSRSFLPRRGRWSRISRLFPPGRMRSTSGFAGSTHGSARRTSPWRICAGSCLMRGSTGFASISP